MTDRVGQVLREKRIGPGLASLWLLIAVSSFVFIEPAPYDIIAVVLCVTFFTLGLKVPSRLGLPLLLMALFVVANILSILFAKPSLEQPAAYLAFYAGLTVYLIVTWVFFTSLVAANPRRVPELIWSGYLVAAIIAVALGLAGYFRLVPATDLLMEHGRARSTFKDPNVFASFLIPVALYLLAAMGTPGWGKRLIRIGLFLVIIIGLLLGFSRGAWGNFAVSLGVFVVLSLATAGTLQRYLNFMSAGSLIALVTVVAIIGAVSMPQINEMFVKRAALLQPYDVEVGGRFSTQRAALQTILEVPIGIGPNRTQIELGRVPHNVYLKVAAENGWLGGITFTAFTLLTVWRGFWFCLARGPHQRMAIVVYASIFGIVVQGLLIDTLHWRHFFLLLGMLWGVILADNKRVMPATGSR